MRKLAIGGYLQWAVIGVVCVAAILVAIVDAVGEVPNWVSIPSLTTAVLGSLVLLLMIDHAQTAKRIEKIEDLNLHSRLLGLSQDAFGKIDGALSDYVSIYSQWKYQKRNAPQAADFVLAYTDEHFAMLRELEDGRLKVPPRLQSHVQHLMLRHMNARFDAVSDRDLDYWLQTESSEYHEAIRSSRRRSGTVVNRIFIFSVAELSQRMKDIEYVLQGQEKCGFGWGIVLWDEIDVLQREAPKVKFDFAFSGDKGVLTYFEKDPNNPRHLHVVLPTPKHEDEILRQKNLYAHMIGECWLVNHQFAMSYRAGLTDDQLRIAEAVATKGNMHVMQMLQRRTDLHSHPLLSDSVLIGREEGSGMVEGNPDFFLLKNLDLSTIERDLRKLSLIVEAL